MKNPIVRRILGILLIVAGVALFVLGTVSEGDFKIGDEVTFDKAEDYAGYLQMVGGLAFIGGAYLAYKKEDKKKDE